MSLALMRAMIKPLMKLALALGLAALFALGASCSSSPIDTSRADEVDLTRYKTYQWIGTTEAEFLRLDNPKQIDSITGYATIVRKPQTEPALKAAVDRQLREKGMVENAASPDFYVTYYGKAKDGDWVSTWAGQAPSVQDVPLIMFPGFEEEPARAFPEGSIVLVFYDARTRKPAWSASMRHVLEGSRFEVGPVTADIGRLASDFQPTG